MPRAQTTGPEHMPQKGSSSLEENPESHGYAGRAGSAQLKRLGHFLHALGITTHLRHARLVLVVKTSAGSGGSHLISRTYEAGWTV